METSTAVALALVLCIALWIPLASGRLDPAQMMRGMLDTD